MIFPPIWRRFGGFWGAWMGFGLGRRGWGRFWRRPGRGIGFGGIATLFGPNALLGAFHCTALWWAMLAMR